MILFTYKTVAIKHNFQTKQKIIIKCLLIKIFA